MPFLLPGQVELLEMTQEHVRALSSVACSEVFSAFDSRRPMAIREVAHELGKSPASVGEHVNTLLEVGLIIVCGSRKRRARTESLYIKKGVITRFVIADHDWETVEAYLGRFDGQMRQIARQHALAQRAIHHTPDFRPFLCYKWAQVLLSPENALRIHAAVEELQGLLQALAEPPTEGGESEGAVRVTLSSILLPSAAESRKRLPKP